MKKIIVLLLCMSMILAMSGCSVSKPEVSPPAQTETKENEAAVQKGVIKFPEFKSTDMEGKEVTNELFAKNNLTLVNLWATF